MNKLKLYLPFLLAILLNFNVLGQEYKKFTLEDLLKKRIFRPDYVWGIRSMNDGEHFTMLNYSMSGATLDKYSYKTGEKIETIVNFNNFHSSWVEDYEFNSDETKILYYFDKDRIYRRSFKAVYYVYDINTKDTVRLAPGKQQLASFSPDGKKVAFMKDNNLFIKDLETGKISQITFDGEKNKIINGAPDWVYEEEFSFNKAYEWSPDGKYLAYIKFNEERVKTYHLIFYAGEAPHYKEYELYPGLYTYKYPKAGEDNSIVSVHIYNLNTGKTVTADIGKNTDIYIPRIRWTQTSEKLAIFRVNRAQNKLDILLANPETGKTKILLTEKDKYYLEDAIYDQIQFLPDNQLIIVSERDGYKHLYLYDMNGKLKKKLTSGNYDVTQFYGYDPENKLFYFQAAKESPLRREIYSVNLKGKITKLSSRKGTNEAEFSRTFKYFINYFSNATTPYYITVNNSKGKEIRTLVDNSELIDKVKEYGGIHKEFIQIPTDNGIKLNGYLLFPPDFDKNKKYPVIISQYNGPGYQTVLDSWQFDWENYMAQEGFIIASVDTRGTGARGSKFQKVTFHNLGKYETKDLINTAKYLATLPYIDGNKIGIWGWSYGGFMVLNALTHSDIFKAGVAIAPVTNWRYYDNIYTERYMGKPQDNPDGYDKNSPLYNAENLKGHLLICHGLADDNVHPQNTFEFVEKLVQANIPYEMYIFTNRNHSIYGGNTRYFLFSRFIEFFEENLKEK